MRQAHLPKAICCRVPEGDVRLSRPTFEKDVTMGFLVRVVCFFACVLLESLTAVSASPPAAAVAAPLKLRVAVLSDGHSRYFVRLLEESLKLMHQPYQIHYVTDVPARRMWRMVEKGDINLFYGMRSAAKDSNRQIIPVRNALTNGLAGQRVLLIRRADTSVFAQIQSVEDLKRTGLIAGLGAGWVDATVWKAAGLPVYEHDAPWRTIYAMVAAGNRRVDYLPRGAIEVLEEARAHPGLTVEPRLLLDYKADFSFYLGASAANYRPIIERALREAEVTGLKARLVDEAFGKDISTLDLNRRIRLHMPAKAQ